MERVALCNRPAHWRAWLPATYYCTHSMGPVMMITGATPVQVNGLIVTHDFDDPVYEDGGIKVTDAMSVLMCTMNNGALVKILPCSGFRDHGNRFRICGNRGSLEITQGDKRLRVHKEPGIDFPRDTPKDVFYELRFPAEFPDAANFGHGGGDYFDSYFFRKAIEEGSEPMIDVYKAVAMTAVGIQGYRSALAKGAPMEIPDFRRKEVRDNYRDDEWNPDPARHKEGYPYPSVLGKIEISAENLAKFKERREKYEKEFL